MSERWVVIRSPWDKSAHPLLSSAPLVTVARPAQSSTGTNARFAPDNHLTDLFLHLGNIGAQTPVVPGAAVGHRVEFVR